MAQISRTYTGFTGNIIYAYIYIHSIDTLDHFHGGSQGAPASGIKKLLRQLCFK